MMRLPISPFTPIWLLLNFNNEINRIKIQIARDHPQLTHVLNELIRFFNLSICSFVKLNNSPQISTLPEHKEILRSIKINIRISF